VKESSQLCCENMAGQKPNEVNSAQAWNKPTWLTARLGATGKSSAFNAYNFARR